MLLIIGFLVVVLSVFGGFALSGGHLLALFQPYELLMIAGAATGSFIVANNLKTIKATFIGIKHVITRPMLPKNFYVELLSLFFEITDRIRKDGALAIEPDVEDYRKSTLFQKYPLVLREPVVMEFLCDHLRLIITGRVDTIHLETIMETDIETYEHESELPIDAIARVADSLPAFGIVAAVMGVVHTMESMGVPPEELGRLVAQALVGTFLGVLIGYGFTAPVAYSMAARRLLILKVLQSIKVVLLASCHQLSPMIAVEMARKVLFSTIRPDNKELEKILKEIKATKAAAGVTNE